MPLYEYQCDACGHRFELIQKFSDAPADKCPKCGGAVHKLQSAPAFQLKGTGWYATDYAKKESSGSGASGKDQKSDAGEKDGKGASADKADNADKTEKSAPAEKPASAPSSATSTGDTKS